MEDLQRCFNEVQAEEEENCSSISDTLSNIDETCKIINNRVTDTCKISIEKGNDLQEMIHNDLQIIKQVVAEGTNKVKYTVFLNGGAFYHFVIQFVINFCSQSRLLAENAIVQGKMLIKQFEEDLCKNCDTLKNYKNCVERNMRTMQLKMEGDKSFILSAINVNFFRRNV